MSSRYWFYTALALWIILSLSVSAITFDREYVLDSLYGSIDWLVAFLPYFFYAALGGLLIDYLVAKKRKEHFKLPFWAKITGAFIMLSIVLCALKIESLSLEAIKFYLAFPFYYCIFFAGYAYTFIYGESFAQFYFAKLVLNIILLIVFALWIKLETTRHPISAQSRAIKDWLLALMFIAFIGGMTKVIINLVFNAT
jgi:hypothetical protein